MNNMYKLRKVFQDTFGIHVHTYTFSLCMLSTSDYRYYSLCKGIQSQLSNNYHIRFPVYCFPKRIMVNTLTRARI